MGPTRILEGEINAGPRQAEVVLRAGHDVPTEIGNDAAVRTKPGLESAAELRHASGFAAVKIAPDDSKRLSWIEGKVVGASAAQNSAATGPDVRREAGTLDRKSHREGSQGKAYQVPVLVPGAEADNAVIERFVVVRHEQRPLDADAEMAMHKIL